MNTQNYKEGCKKGMGDCPPQCLSSICSNLNLGEYDGEPKNYPQNTFCNCPYRKKRFNPLDIIEAWIDACDCGGLAYNNLQEILSKDIEDCDDYDIFKAMIKEIRNNLDDVVKRGRKEEWLK
jgi:hypothetical protein